MAKPKLGSGARFHHLETELSHKGIKTPAPSPPRLGATSTANPDSQSYPQRVRKMANKYHQATNAMHRKSADRMVKVPARKAPAPVTKGRIVRAKKAAGT